jgi:hypothetical protein
MGDHFNPIDVANPFFSPLPNPLSRGGGNGGSSSNSGTITTPTTPAYSTPSNLFEPYQKYIPEAMNSNAPITDPSAILRAYSQNLPEFRAAAQPSQTPPISQSLGSRQQKGT